MIFEITISIILSNIIVHLWRWIIKRAKLPRFKLFGYLFAYTYGGDYTMSKDDKIKIWFTSESSRQFFKYQKQIK